MSDHDARRSGLVRESLDMPGAFTPPNENWRASGLELNAADTPPFGGSSSSSTLRNRSTAESAGSSLASTTGLSTGDLAGPTDPSLQIEPTPKVEELGHSPALRRDGSLSSSWDSFEDSSDGMHASSSYGANASRGEAPSSSSRPDRVPEPPREHVEEPLDEQRRPEPPVNAPPPQAPADEPQCRICLGGVEDSDELGPLIRPCRCSGTISVSICIVFDFIVIY